MLSISPASSFHPDFSSGRKSFLGLSLLVPWILGLLCVVMPVIYWSDSYNPRSGGWQSYTSPWHNTFTTDVVIILCVSLFIFPLWWIVTKRVIDSIGLALGQQALIFGGYFYLDQTAAHFPDSAEGILTVSGLVVLFNAIGFLCFFIGLGTVYGLTAILRYQLRPLAIPASLLDERLISIARMLSYVCAVCIAAPMVLTHNIPMLASDDTSAREELIANSTSRAFFQASGALLPFVTTILVVAILRKPRLVWGREGFMVFLMLFFQFMTTDRLPMAITVAVVLSAATMQLRLPRWLLVILFISYLFMFTLLSGFTSLLRQNPHGLNGNWISNSIEEAYLGDNIIDLRDGSWVFSKWDFDPFMGKTYLGGAFSMVPSGIFPQKKQWHLGLTGVRIVGMPEEEHFGLRMTFFAEAFLNFGWAGVFVVGTLLGSLYAIVLRQIHLVAQSGGGSCLYRNMTFLILLQCLPPLSNTSDGFMFWSQLGLLFLMWLVVAYPLHWPKTKAAFSKNSPSYPNEPRTTGA